ncbi:MAG: DNA repair exonuclease [Methanobacteriaceae archaeon]|nr:DNA repair exonuclease [Methanobacteriaceae archaeon]
MVKFLHTADWHLGLKYTQLGPNADKARKIRIKTCEKLIIAAKNEDVDFIIIAGDLFDSNDVDRQLIAVVSKIFAEASTIPIFILPGNHDPLTKDSLYLDPTWETLDNVTIFQESEPFRIDYLGTTLYPCPITQKQSNIDFTEWISAQDNEISVGIAHGNLQIEGFIQEPNFPIAPDRVEKSGLNYLALGEWHSLFPLDNVPMRNTIYPGTPETTKFGEENSGKAVIVEIDNPNTEPSVKTIDVGTLSWQKQEKQVNNLEDVQNLKSELESLTNPSDTAIKMTINGVVDQEVYNHLDLLQEEYSSQLMLLKLNKDSLYLKPNLLELKALLPEGTIINQTFESLTALMKFYPRIQEYSDINSQRAEEIFSEIKDLESVQNINPEVLNQAFLTLYQMTKEASG